MTTIAYRDRILAADTLVTDHGMLLGYACKLAQSQNGPIAGGAGNMPYVATFLKWFENCLPGASPPRIDVDKDPDGIIIDLEGRVWLWGGEPHLTELLLDPAYPFAAIGAGAKYAMGAMLMGASAEQSVQAAAAFDIYTGGRIDTLQLPSSPPNSSRKP